MIKLTLRILIFTTVLFVGRHVQAQFILSGSANQNCHEFSVTDNAQNQRGAFFNNFPIDITNDIYLAFQVKFGCNDNGGEGMAFVLQDGTNQNPGNPEDMGFGNQPNSVAIEFDTRNSTNATPPISNDDPDYDHLDIMLNGNIYHFSPDAVISGGPQGVVPVAGNGNLEDCEFHFVEIYYTAASTELRVDIDSNTQFIQSIDLTSFLPSNMVNWGWTAATGNTPFHNKQEVHLALEPSFTATSAVCPGSSVTFTGSANSYNPITTYEWDFDNDGTIDATGNSAIYTFPSPGDYNVKLYATDDQGCIDSNTLTYSIGFDVPLTVNPPSVCTGGGTSQLEANPDPYTPQECEHTLIWGDTWGDGWNGNNIELFIDGVSQGTYSMLNIGTPSADSIKLDLPQDANVQICYNQNNTATAESEIYFSLEDNTGTAVIDVQAGDIPTNTPAGSTVCNNTTIDCGFTPPTYNYNWTVTGNGSVNNNGIFNPVATINGPGNVTYQVEVTDQSTGCSVTVDTLIETVPDPVAELSGTDQVCQGDSASLTVNFPQGTGPFTIEYQDGNSNTITISGITSNPYTLKDDKDGTYSLVSVAGSGGCPGTVSGTAQVTVIPRPDVVLSNDTSYCEDDISSPNPLYTLSNNGGNVTWYDDNTLTNVLGTGNTYTPTGLTLGQNVFFAQEEENVMNCPGAYDSVIVTVNPVPAAPTISGTTTYCDGDSFSPLNASGAGGGYFSWYDGANNHITNGPSYTPSLGVGNFTFYATETISGCESPQTSVNVTVKETPPAPNMSSDATYCQGETILDMTATDNLGGSITWSSDPNGTNVITTGSSLMPNNTLGTTTYYVTETFNGCTGPPGEIDITINEFPFVEVPEEVEICNGDSIEVNAQNNGFGISWSNGSVDSTTWLGPNVTTTYLVSSTNNCGTYEDTIDVIVYDPPTVIASDDETTGLGGEVELNATGGQSYDWVPSVNQCLDDSCREVYVIPTQTTTYIVTGTDENGCTNTDTVVVTVDGEMQIFVPNIFSPNGDGYHEKMVIRGPRLFDFKLLVFDRWGKLMYEADQQRNFWDGTFEGKPVSQGVYVYRITGKNILGIDVETKGNITIVR